MKRVLRSLSLLDADGNLSLTSVVWLATLGLAIWAAIAGSWPGLIPFALATLSAEHRRHLSRTRVADQLRTLNESLRNLAAVLEETRKVAIDAQQKAAQLSMQAIGIRRGA